MKVIFQNDKNFPPLLKEIPNPPDKLYIEGENINWSQFKFLTVVGSRKNSIYGKMVCEKLIKGLRGYPVVVVSGLAYGVDTIAHKAALDADIKTVAIPGSGIDFSVLYPRANITLAKRIIKNGGALLSEFEPKQKATKWSFPQRNRIMAGISHATLIVEAQEKSGTLITARLAVEYNRELLAVPHDITRDSAKGVLQFLKLGAFPVSSSDDILEILKIDKKEVVNEKPELTLSKEEKFIIENLKNSPSSKAALVSKAKAVGLEILTNISKMELSGKIKEENGFLFLK